MQDLMPNVGADAQLIQSYGAGGFRIGNQQYDTPVLVLPNQTLVWTGAWDIAAFAPIIAAEPKVEVLLIGTGARHVMLDVGLRTALKAQGLAVDSMDTGAACRTFNVLLTEGRRAAVALQLAQ